MRLCQGAQDHANHHRRGRKVIPAHQHTQQTDAVEQEQVKRALAHTVGSHGGKNQNARVQLRTWNLQQLHPNTHHGQIEHQQHQVADVQRCNQRPHQSACTGKQLRARVDAVILECTQQHGRGIAGGDSQRQQRNQGRGHRRVVRSFGARNTFNRALGAELCFVFAFGQLFLGGVAQKCRYFGATGGNAAKRCANHCAAYPCGHRAFPVAARHVHACHLVLRGHHLAFVQRCVQHLGHRKQANGHQHDVDAVHQLHLAPGVAGSARDLVHPHATHRQPQKQRRHAAQAALPQDSTHCSERQHHQHEVLGWPQSHGKICHRWCKQRHDHRSYRARHKRANGRCSQRSAGTAILGHLVAFHGGHHAGGFAWRIQQDGSGGPAIHGTVVDARKENHGGGDFHLGRNGQQHGNGHSWANAGQHTHGSPQSAAKQRPQQINRCHRSGKTLH